MSNLYSQGSKWQRAIAFLEKEVKLAAMAQDGYLQRLSVE